MRMRSFSFAARLAGLIGLACLAACRPPTDPHDQKPVQQAFEDFKGALNAKQAQQAIDVLDKPTRDYLHAAVTDSPNLTAPDEEVRELIRQATAKLTPGGIQPGFKLETPLQRVLNAGWINAHDLEELNLGPVTIQGELARGEIIWQGEPTTVQLLFVRESGAWKIDLLQMVGFAEMALRADRTVKGQSETEQIARLVAQVPKP